MGRRTFGSIRQRGSGRFQARYKGPDGVTHTAPMTYPTARDAEAYLAVIEADIIRQSWRAPSSATEYLAAYGERVINQRQLKPQSRLAYLADWQNHIAPTLGKKRVGNVSPADVRDWHQKLSANLAEQMGAIQWTSTGGRRDGSATVARCYRILRMVMNTAVGDKLLVSNPCNIKGAGNYKKPSRPTLTAAEVEELASSVHPRYRALVLILAWTGLRLGEACALRWRHIDLQGLSLTVEEAVYPVEGVYVFGDPKSEAGKRRVGIDRLLAAEIGKHAPEGRREDDLVIMTRSKGVAYGAAQTNITRTLRGMGRTDIRVHDLRHTGHMLASQEGASLADLMQRLGHATVDASMVYAHASKDHGRAVTDRLGERRAEVIELASKRSAG